MKIVVNLDIFFIFFWFLNLYNVEENQYMHVEHKTLHIMKTIKYERKYTLSIIYTSYIQSKMFKMFIICVTR